MLLFELVVGVGDGGRREEGGENGVEGSRDKGKNG